MSGIKYAAFALAAVCISTAILVSAFAAADLYYHYKLQKKGLYNIWGYRRPVAGPKPPGQFRLAVIGGSAAAGWGAPMGRSFPAYLEQMLNRTSGNGRSYSIVNLAWNNEGAHSFIFTLRDYAYLNYDAVIFYTGYNDLNKWDNRYVFRHQSPIFRLTGYLPLLPGMMLDKAKILRQGLGINEINLGKKRANFTPGFIGKTKASALEIGGRIALSLESQLGRLTDPDRGQSTHGEAGCGKRWAFYCGEIRKALDFALKRKTPVAVVTQPYISDSHVDQQNNLASFLRRRFRNERRIVHFNLGKTLRLKDRALSIDGMHLTARGNEIIAKSLAAPLTAFLRKHRRAGTPELKKAGHSAIIGISTNNQFHPQ